LSGTFAGQLTFSSGPVSTSAALNEQSNGTISIPVQFSGLSPNPDTFTGNVIGNAAAVTGSCPSGQSPSCNQGDPIGLTVWYSSQNRTLQVLPNGFLNGELNQQ
jgi:hypothetical protein